MPIIINWIVIESFLSSFFRGRIRLHSLIMQYCNIKALLFLLFAACNKEMKMKMKTDEKRLLYLFVPTISWLWNCFARWCCCCLHRHGIELRRRKTGKSLVNSRLIGANKIFLRCLQTWHDKTYISHRRHGLRFLSFLFYEWRNFKMKVCAMALNCFILTSYAEEIICYAYD